MCEWRAKCFPQWRWKLADSPPDRMCLPAYRQELLLIIISYVQFTEL